MSVIERIQPPGVAVPVEPYGQLIRVGNHIFLAGQVALDEHLQLVGRGDPRVQAEQCWKNIRACLSAAGADVQNVVKVVCYLTDIRHMKHEMEVRRSLFKEGEWPVYTMVQVSNLGLEDLLFEIDATAVLTD